MKIARRFKNGRLAYYKATASAAYWDSHWQQNYSAESYSWALKGELGWLEKPFNRYLPGKGRILEAGCGLGYYVLALNNRGYNAEGVEWASDTVNFVKQIRPDLPIRVGNVTKLDVPDGYYEAYISLGVVEHRKEGPEPFLKEAYRVLSQDGVVLISVPHINLLRRLKVKLGSYKDNCKNLEFYQYAYSTREIATLLGTEGFKIIGKYYYDSYKGLKDEIPPIRHLLSIPVFGPFLGRVMRSKHFSFILSPFAHMILFICKKDNSQ